MAIAFVKSAQNTVAASTTVAVTLSVTTGNLIVLCVSADNFVTISGVSDGVNTYTSGLDVTKGADPGRFWHTVATTTASITITATVSSSAFIGLIVQEFSGHTSWVIDKTASNSSSGSSLTSGNTATTTVADELIVGIALWGTSGGAATLGAGYSNLASITSGGVYSALESKVVSSVGIQSAELTVSASPSYTMGCVTIYGTGRVPKSALAFIGNLGII